MKFLSKLKEILTLPAKATELVLKNQAIEKLTELLVKFIQALGIQLDDTIVHTLVLSLVSAVIYLVIGWVTSYFSNEGDEEEESVTIPEVNSESECCDFDFSFDENCDCE